MTGRERFEAVINHKKPDKVPFYVPTFACSVASAILGRPALGGADSLHFKEEKARFLGDAALEEFEGQYFEDTAAIARKLRIDITRETWRMRGKPDKMLDDNTLLFGDEHGEHIIKKFYPETQSYGVVEDTRKQQTAEDIIELVKKRVNMPPPKADKDEAIAGMAGAKSIYDLLKDLDLGVLSRGWMPPMTLFDPAWLLAMALAPELMAEYALWGLDAAIGNMETLADMGYKWFCGGADLASNTGPMFSPALFETILTKPLKIYADACKNKGVVYSYATDGNIEIMFEAMFVKTGVMAFGEVDRDAGMTLALVRERLPGVIVLGNMSSTLLATGTPEEVYQSQVRQLEESEGYDFIAGPSNAVVHGTPVANIYAMIEAIDAFTP